MSPAIPDAVVALSVATKPSHPLSVLAELLSVGPRLGALPSELLGVGLEPLAVGKNLLVELLCLLLVFPIVGTSSGRRVVRVLRIGHCRARSHRKRSRQRC